jgi:hypothetical protein
VVLENAPDQRLHVRFDTDVGHDRRSADFGSHDLRSRSVDVSNHDRRGAIGGEAARERGSDPAGAAGHDGNPTRDFHYAGNCGD